MMSSVEGYVVDIACLRRYPASEYAERAREHTTSCALMGHCVESGYAVVDDSGVAHLLDTHATPHVVAALQRSGDERGVFLVVQRKSEEGEMVTRVVQQQPQRNDASRVTEVCEDEFGDATEPSGPTTGDPGRDEPRRSGEESSTEAQQTGAAANAD